MSLSFNPSELKILAEFNSKTHYLAIDTKAQGEGKNSIISIEKRTVTCWEKFKALFNRGVLAHKKFHLIEVTEHLATYDIKPLQRAWAEDVIREERLKGLGNQGELTIELPSDERGGYITLWDLAKKAHLKGASFFVYSEKPEKLYKAASICERKSNVYGTPEEHWHNLDTLNQDRKKFAEKVLKVFGDVEYPL